MVSDQTATLLLLYFVNLILFFKANTTYSFLRHSFLSYACPMLLILVSIVYQLYEYFVLFGNERISRGLFNLQVLWNLVKAPTIAVSFRDVYSADVLTSFTRIIADSMYAICWVISGTFLIPVDRKDSHMDLHNFGSDYMSCTNPTMYTFVSYIQLIPLITRALQCLRSFRDQNYSVYPQGYNCLKYLSSILVVVVGLQSNVNVGMYICLIIFSTIYKWWWDVAMDWGLFDNLPSNVWEFLEVWNYPRKRIFLRSSLMYPSVYLYYFCILLDLVLRLLWVLSLVPATLLGSLVGYQLSLFVGSMEIIRRCMWGFLRVEYEHLKMLRQQTPGFLPNRVVRKSVDHGKEGTIAQPPFHIKNKQNKDSRLNLRKIVPSEIELSGGGNNAGMTSPNRYKAFPSQNVAMDADRGNLVALFQDLDDSERVEKMSDEEEEGSYIV